MNNDFFKKVMVVLFGIFVFRLGTYLPVPFVDPYVLSMYSQQTAGTILDIFNTFSGGSIERFSILAVGIMPYITASIIMQMMGYFSASIKTLKESGEKGQRKVNLYTRYITLFFALIQSIALTAHLSGQTVNGLSLVTNPDLSFYLVAVTSLVFGTMFLLWLGEKLTEFGLGSGISVIIFAGIASGLPEIFFNIVSLVSVGSMNALLAFVFLAFFIAFIGFIVFVESSQRRIQLSTASQHNSDKGYLPLKVNIAGIIPVIFASSIIIMPATFVNFFGDYFESDILANISNMLSRGGILYFAFLSILILFFSFFYSKLVFNSKKTSEKLKRSGAFLKGIRAGKPTELHLTDIANRVTFIGACYLIFISVVPEILLLNFNVPFYLGGTSLLIIVLVCLEWNKQYELHQQSKVYGKLKNKLLDNF
jgi:preprotein translocase subunit SecY